MNVGEILDEVRGLDINDIGSWPLYARVSAIALVCTLLAGAGYWFMVKPRLETLDRVKVQEQTLRATFEDKQGKVAALDAYRRQLDTMQRSFGAMLQQLPSRSEVANLLNDISRTRAASGLEEELFRPQSEVKKEFYAALPNEIRVVGTYHELGTFVSGVAALSRIVTVENVKIVPLEGDEQQGSDGTLLRMDAILKTYRYLEEGESGASDANGKGQS